MVIGLLVIGGLVIGLLVIGLLVIGGLVIGGLVIGELVNCLPAVAFAKEVTIPGPKVLQRAAADRLFWQNKA